MKRFELDCTYRSGSTQYGSYHHWWPTDAEVKMMEWLAENVSPVMGYEYRLPMRGDGLHKGEGWVIYKGFSEDAKYDDFDWRHTSLGYKGKGKFGHWLQIDDDDKAMFCLLSGVLDDCLWKGDKFHNDFEVMSVRRQDPDYPQLRFR